MNIRSDTKDLFRKHLNDSKYQWMRDRITRLWPEWKLAAEELQVESLTVRNRKRKNVSSFLLGGSVAQWLGRLP